MEEKVGFVYERHTGSLLSSSKNLPDNVKRALSKYFKKSLGCKSNTKTQHRITTVIAPNNIWAQQHKLKVFYSTFKCTL